DLLAFSGPCGIRRGDELGDTQRRAGVEDLNTRVQDDRLSLERLDENVGDLFLEEFRIRGRVFGHDRHLPVRTIDSSQWCQTNGGAGPSRSHPSIVSYVLQ